MSFIESFVILCWVGMFMALLERADRKGKHFMVLILSLIFLFVIAPMIYFLESLPKRKVSQK